MKFRKAATAALAAAMLVSSVSIVSYAEEDEAMKQELTYVKQRVDIPEELTEFNYNKRDFNNRTTYNFSWSAPETGDRNEYRTISVSVCGKVITSYSDYSNSRWQFSEYSFGKLTKEQIAKKAEQAVKKLNPTVYKNIRLDTDSISISLYSSEAAVKIERVENGIPISGQSGYVRLDKNTGELLDYSLSWIFGAGFGDSKKAISKEKAEECFEKEFPVSLLYTAEYDWETKGYVPHLIYKRDVFGQIDAFTGEKATFEGSYANYEDKYDEDADDDDCDVAEDAAGAVGIPSAEVSFTDKELEKLQQEDKLIKPEAQLETLKKAGIYNLPDTAKVSYSSTRYNQRCGAYTTTVGFRADPGDYISLDHDDIMPYDPNVKPAASEVAPGMTYFSGSCNYNAETGEIISYYSSASYSKEKESSLRSEKSAKKLLTEYLNTIADSKAGEFKVNTPDYSYSGSKKTNDLMLLSASVNSPRYVNDIPCSLEHVYLAVDRSGKVSSYDLVYYGIEYPSNENIISNGEAYKKYFEQIDYSLLYRCALHNGNVETALVYKNDKEMYIDAFTGKLTSSNGVELTNSVPSGYTDLEGSKYAKIAEKLAMYGITLMDENGRLKADSNITRADFNSLIRRIGCGGTVEDGDKELTRKYAAKLFAQRKLSAEVAELPGLFKSPFSDVKESDKYVGYIALATKLGYMSGKDGKFKPNGKITRGEALKMVYDLLDK